MPLDTFKERLDVLGLRPRLEASGGSYAAIFDTSELRVIIEHSGYGGGYGGPRPVRVMRFRVERPTGRPGSVLVEGAIERAQKIVLALTKPAPAVHDFHPESIRLAVLAFCDAEDVKRCRVVRAPIAFSAELRGDSLEARLLAYARVAGVLGSALSIYRAATRPISGLFRGDLAALQPRVESLAREIGDSAILIEAGQAPSSLRIEDPLTISLETVRPLSDAIASAKQARQFTRLEVDAGVAQSLTIARDVEASVLKAQLEELAKAAASFVVAIDGVGKETKRGKLPSLATALRASVQAGKAVTIRPAGVRTTPTELQF
jgi:hypothetical protein